MIAAFLIGLAGTILLDYTDELLFYIPGVIGWTYFVCSVVILSSNTSVKAEYRKYIDAKDKFELLQTNKVTSLRLANDFVKDVENMNELIEKSNKYYNNWYLGILYHEETGKLQTFDLKSISLNVTL
jgi:hypothetical protein